MSTHGRTHWIKLYVEMLDDPKVGLLPDAVKWRWVSSLLLAGELNENGFLPDINDAAWRLHTNVETLQGEMRTLAGRGLVELREHPDGGERWFIPAFVKRQEAATSTERSRNLRHRRRQNSNETHAQHIVAFSSHNTETETEAEAEAEGEKSGAIAPAPPAPVDLPYQPVPEEVQKQKRRRGIHEPEPAIVSTAPAAVKLLADLTGYWPGDDVAPALVKEFGDTPDEPALGKAVEFWRLSGYKLTNWLGIAEWYKEIRRRPDWTPQDRFKNGNGANGHGKAAPAKTVSTPVPGSQPLFS